MKVLKFKTNMIAAFVLCLSFVSAYATWTINTENLTDRDAVIAAVDEIFNIAETVAEVKTVTIANPGAQSYLYLNSYGAHVTIMAIVYIQRDNEIPQDSAEWDYSDEAPIGVVGDMVRALSVAKETEWKQLIEQNGFSYEEEYLVNYTTTGEIAMYQKTLSATFPKATAASSAKSVIVSILDDIYKFDWSKSSIKKTVPVQ
ncbi:MAG: hypothetical protein ACPGSB_08825 [Opitutales bacterium]